MRKRRLKKVKKEEKEEKKTEKKTKKKENKEQLTQAERLQQQLNLYGDERAYRNDMIALLSAIEEHLRVLSVAHYDMFLENKENLLEKELKENEDKAD